MAATKKFLVHLDLSQNELRNAVGQGIDGGLDSATGPSAPVNGQFYYNKTTKSFWLFDGAIWIDFANRATQTGNITTTVISDFAAALATYSLSYFLPPTGSLDIANHKLINVTNGSGLQDAVAFGQLTAAVDVLTGSIATNAATAASATATVATNLGLETTRATNAENALGVLVTSGSTATSLVATNLANEITRATNAETALSGSTFAETTRAFAAEGVLQTNINTVTTSVTTERNRALAAESAITGSIADELARALGQEAAIRSEFVAADTVLSRSLHHVAFTGNFSDLVGDIVVDAQHTALVNLGDPVEAQDATTKIYVDTQLSASINALRDQIAGLETLEDIADRAYVNNAITSSQTAQNTAIGLVYETIADYTTGQAAQNLAVTGSINDAITALNLATTYLSLTRYVTTDNVVGRLVSLEAAVGTGGGVAAQIADAIAIVSGTFAVDQLRQDTALATEVTNRTNADSTEVTNRNSAITTVSGTFALDQIRQDTALTNAITALSSSVNVVNVAQDLAISTLSGYLEADYFDLRAGITGSMTAITNLSSSIRTTSAAADVAAALALSNAITGLSGTLHAEDLVIRDLITNGNASLTASIAAEVAARIAGDAAEHAFVSGLTLDFFSAPSGSLNLFGHPITGVGTPTGGTDAVNVNYVTNLLSNTDWKESVKAVSTGNVTLTGLQTVGGVALGENDRVLLKNQTTPTQNGIYVAHAAAWTRATDATGAALTEGASVFVESVDAQYTLADAAGGVWIQIGGAGTYLEGSGIDITGNVISVEPNTAHKFDALLSGSFTDYNVTHGLGTRIVTCQVYDEASGDTVECGVSRGTNDVTLRFNTAPVNGTYHVVVVG